MTWVLGGILKAPRCVLTGVVGAFPRHPEAPFFFLLASTQWEQLFGCCLDTALVCQMAASQGRHPAIAQCKEHSSLENIWIKSLWSEHAGLTAALIQLNIITQRTQEDLTKKKKNNLALFHILKTWWYWFALYWQYSLKVCLKIKPVIFHFGIQYKPCISKPEVMKIKINQNVFHNKTRLVCGRPKNKRKRKKKRR